MAKTIRSHPTSHILVLEPICSTTVIFSGLGPKMDLHFLYYPTSLRVKRPAPKGKKMRMDHPFILGSVNISVCILYLQSVFISFEKPKKHFLKLLSYFNHFVYLRFKMGDPILLLLLFQNRTLISKLEPYPKGCSAPTFPMSTDTLSCSIILPEGFAKVI